MKTHARSCIYLLSALLLGGTDAMAQNDRATGRQRRKVYNYSSTVQWSQSPFDASTINDDDAPSLKKDLQEMESDSPAIEMPQNMTPAYNSLPNARRSRSRNDKDNSGDLLSEPVEDVESIINEAPKDTDESGWGWLADDILREQNKKGLLDGHTDDDPFGVSQNSNKENYSDAEEYEPPRRSNSSSEQSASHYKNAIRKDDIGSKTAKHEKQAGARSEQMAGTKADEDYVFSQWEKDLGLDKPITERSGSGLRSSAEISRGITQKMLYHEQNNASEAAKYTSESQRTPKQETGITRRKSASSISRQDRNTESFNARFSAASSSLSRDKTSLSGLKTSTGFKGNSVSPNNAFSTFKPTEPSATPSLFNQQQSSAFDIDNQSKSSNLETFRKLHKSDGIYRPFGGSSSSWAD